MSFKPIDELTFPDVPTNEETLKNNARSIVLVSTEKRLDEL